MTRRDAARASIAAAQRARLLAQLRVAEEARRRGLRTVPRARDVRVRAAEARTQPSENREH